MIGGSIDQSWITHKLRDAIRRPGSRVPQLITVSGVLQIDGRAGQAKTAGRRAERCAAMRWLAVKWLCGRRQWRSHGLAEEACRVPSLSGAESPSPAPCGLSVLACRRWVLLLLPTRPRARLAAAPRRLDAPLLATSCCRRATGATRMAGTRRSRPDAGRGMCLLR